MLVDVDRRLRPAGGEHRPCLGHRERRDPREEIVLRRLDRWPMDHQVVRREARQPGAELVSDGVEELRGWVLRRPGSRRLRLSGLEQESLVVAAELERDEARRSHGADQVRRIVVNRGQACNAPFGEIFEDHVRGLESVLVTCELIVRDLDEGRVSQGGRVFAVVVVDASVEGERAGDQVARLVTTACAQLNLKRSRRNSCGRQGGAPVVGCPFEVGDLRPEGHLDGDRLHRVVEIELQRGSWVDLHAIGERSACRSGDRSKVRHDQRREAPCIALNPAMADIEDRFHAHGVRRQVIERFGGRPRVLRLTGDCGHGAIGARGDRKSGLHCGHRNRTAESEENATVGWYILLTALQVRDKSRGQRVLVGEECADAGEDDDDHEARGDPPATGKGRTTA